VATLKWTRQPAPGGITATTYVQLAVDPINGVTLMLSNGGSVFRSTDGCQTTASTNPGNTPSCIGYGNGVWISGTNAGIRRSTDGGVTWSANISYGTGWAGSSGWVAFASGLGGSNGTWLIVGDSAHANQFSTSTDGGQTWSAASTISGVLTSVQRSSFGMGLGWDGTVFWYSGIRDSGNTNSVVGSYNGTTWSTAAIDGIFNTFGDCGSIVFSPLIGYMAISSVSRTIRLASTLAGLNSATNVAMSSFFPNSNTAQGSGATDLFFIVTGNAAEIAEVHNAVVSNGSLPFTGSFADVFVWDQKNGFVIGVGGGGSAVLITAPYKGFASTLANATVSAGEGGIQLSTTEGTSGLWDVNGIVGGNSTIGTISATGFYTAPNVPPANPVVIARNTNQGLQVVTSITVVLPYVGGQKLGPRGQPGQLNPNVTASAGNGGDIWGANGGGVTPVGGGVTGQTGYDRPIMVTMSDAERRTTYQITPNNPSLVQQVSTTAIPTTTLDSSLPPGGGSSG
jgi:hypothetical protein